MLLERILIRLIELGVVAALAYLLVRFVRQLPPLKWYWLAVQSKPMRLALGLRNHIAGLVRDRKATPDGVGLLCDVDDLMGSVVELVEVRLGLGTQERHPGSGEAATRLQTAVQRTDQHLDVALQRLDDIRACLLEFAADRMEERLADARNRFRDRAEQPPLLLQSLRQQGLQVGPRAHRAGSKDKSPWWASRGQSPLVGSGAKPRMPRSGKLSARGRRRTVSLGGRYIASIPTACMRTGGSRRATAMSWRSWSAICVGQQWQRIA